MLLFSILAEKESEKEHAPGLWKCGGKYFLNNVNSLLHKTIFVLGRPFHFEEEMGRLNTPHVKLCLSGIPSDALCIRNKV